ncbi:GNAT family N-acetyltransferase [Caulobacter sp. NIBR2454]|uniref:GNAT family N-acetyltransferase n=1 Tax=Caulobacter sp. NIBR2454 TaxID=3015996 RepID=UPI0022B6577E|nr:GNAT family N-acetyltransferase [Caulobacter sp. NIBR2454]
MTITLRRAGPSDIDLVFSFVRDLAEHQGDLDHMHATRADLAAALFAPQPHAFCDIAERDGEVLGGAVWFYTFSTWTGRRGIYLEDLFVRPAARGSGAGRVLLASLARRAVEEGCARVEWAVSNHNVDGAAFYARQGAVGQESYRIWRLDGEAMQALAEG